MAEALADLDRHGRLQPATRGGVAGFALENGLSSTEGVDEAIRDLEAHCRAGGRNTAALASPQELHPNQDGHVVGAITRRCEGDGAQRAASAVDEEGIEARAERLVDAWVAEIKADCKHSMGAATHTTTWGSAFRMSLEGPANTLNRLKCEREREFARVAAERARLLQQTADALAIEPSSVSASVALMELYERLRQAQIGLGPGWFDRETTAAVRAPIVDELVRLPAAFPVVAEDHAGAGTGELE